MAPALDVASARGGCSRPRMSTPLPASLVSPAGLAGLACLVMACGTSDPAELRRAEIRAVLEAHLEHEVALLEILEQHEGEPDVADAALRGYLGRHGAAMRALCDKRRVLETDATALAIALGDLEPRMKEVFERRRDLAARHPELLARPDVRAALAALDAL